MRLPGLLSGFKNLQGEFGFSGTHYAYMKLGFCPRRNREYFMRPAFRLKAGKKEASNEKGTDRFIIVFSGSSGVKRSGCGY